jgi:two-component system OmpR family sensor kinase
VGRLFWKFFAFAWLVQLAGIAALFSTFWLSDLHLYRSLDLADSTPAQGSHVQVAAAILHRGGFSAFERWVAHEPRQTVLAVDQDGHDLLNRPAAPSLVTRARQLYANDPASTQVVEATDDGSHRYLMFAADSDTIGAHGPPHFPPLVPTLAILLSSLLTAMLIARYVAKPIRSLRSAFDAVAAGDLSLRVVPQIGTRHDELADLGRHFDLMAERLQLSMSAQRRLLHDVSHELRSPLARLQAAVGLARHKPSWQQSAIDRIELESMRIDRLVGDLLRLSRLEAGELAEVEEEIRLHELIGDIVADANFEARDSGRVVIWSNPMPAAMRGRPEMLHGAIENVIRNALKHAPSSREIHLETSVGASHYELRVLDDGPGLHSEELPRLFTPFFRSANGIRTEGYGLGLAIARRSVEAHGGSIRAENRPNGGLAVIIVLPITIASASITPPAS